MEEKTQNKQKKKKSILFLLIVLVLIGIGIGAFYYMQFLNKGRLARDEHALGGLLPGKTPSEITDLLNQKVKEGMVDIGIAGEPVFEEKGKKGRIGIENIPGNNYAFQVDLVLTETGETLYSSGLIEPGYYIEYIGLNRTLSLGKHKAVAVFTTYPLDGSGDEIAKAKVEVSLNVLEGKHY
ncbi:MAG: hypothetical protein ACRCU3_10520 [Eubacteriaceae bacterium]